jgi:hypothetical protein
MEKFSMKKIILSGLCAITFSTGITKPSVASFITFPIKKAASTTKYSALTTFSAMKIVGNTMLGTCKIAKDIIMELPTTFKSLCYAGTEGTQLVISILALIAILYGVDAACEYATKFGLPRNIIGTYEFGTLYKTIEKLVSQKNINSIKETICKLYKKLPQKNIQLR